MSLSAGVIYGFQRNSHGEIEHNDMVEYFGEQLDGFAFTANGWVQSSPRVPEIGEMVELLSKAVMVLPIENVWVNPDCGLKFGS